jgi:hypothetical protein
MTKVDLPKEEQRISNENVVVGGPGVIFMTESVPDSLRSAPPTPLPFLVGLMGGGECRCRKKKKQLLKI